MVETKKAETILAGTSNNGFFILFPGTDRKPMHFNRINGFQADWILSLLEDREGNLWVGTGGSRSSPDCVQTTFKPSRRRTAGADAGCCPSPPALMANYGLGRKAQGCIAMQSGAWENFGYTNGIGNSLRLVHRQRPSRTTCSSAPGAPASFCATAAVLNSHRGWKNVMLPVPALYPQRTTADFGSAPRPVFYIIQTVKPNWFSDAGGNPFA